MGFKDDIKGGAVMTGCVLLTCGVLTGVGACAINIENQNIERKYFQVVKNDAHTICLREDCTAEMTAHIDTTVNKATSKLRTVKVQRGGITTKDDRALIREKVLKNHEALHDEKTTGE